MPKYFNHDLTGETGKYWFFTIYTNDHGINDPDKSKHINTSSVGTSNGEGIEFTVDEILKIMEPSLRAFADAVDKKWTDVYNGKSGNTDKT